MKLVPPMVTPNNFVSNCNNIGVALNIVILNNSKMCNNLASYVNRNDKKAALEAAASREEAVALLEVGLLGF